MNSQRQSVEGNLIMNNTNLCIFDGHLTKDIVLKYYPNNNEPYASFSIGVSESWKDKATGEPREKTQWPRILVKGKIAEACSKYLHKGSKVFVMTKLETNSWQDAQGVTQYSNDYVVKGFVNGTKIDFLESRPKGDNQKQTQYQQSQASPYQQKQQTPQTGFNDSFKDDQIPI